MRKAMFFLLPVLFTIAIIPIISWQLGRHQSFAPLTAVGRKNYILNIDAKEISKPIEIKRKNRPLRISCNVIVKLTNNSHDTLKYLTMSCSWDDNFRFDNYKFGMMGWNCDKNIPVTKIVPPHKTLPFIIPIICDSTVVISATRFRIGIIIIKESINRQFIDFLPMDNDLTRFKNNLIWSNEVEIVK